MCFSILFSLLYHSDSSLFLPSYPAGKTFPNVGTMTEQMTHRKSIGESGLLFPSPFFLTYRVTI